MFGAFNVCRTNSIGVDFKRNKMEELLKLNKMTLQFKNIVLCLR